MYYDVDLPPVPELIELKVYRDRFISQERVDDLCQLLWDERPDLLQQLALQEGLPFPNNRDWALADIIGHMVNFFRDKEEAGELETISMIAMVDLTYEIDRRVRKAIGEFDIEPAGEPIAENPEGPFPELIELPIYRNQNGQPQKGVTQEKSDHFCKEAYELLTTRHPEVLYAYCELGGRYLRYGEPNTSITMILKKKYENIEPDWRNLKTEIGSRLSFMSYAKNAYNKLLEEHKND